MIHAYAFKVRLHDVDSAGVMFFARLFSHAHDAYEDYMAKQGMELGTLIEGGTRLPIVHAEADYLHPLRHGEDMTVELTVERLGNTAFTIGYAFRNNDEIRAWAKTVHVFLDPSTQLPAPLPEAIRERLTPLCPDTGETAYC